LYGNVHLQLFIKISTLIEFLVEFENNALMYLGIPTSIGLEFIDDWTEILQKFKNKINMWRAQWLNMVG